MENTVYRPLLKEEIRLLQLLPSSGQLHLSGRLVHVKLENGVASRLNDPTVRVRYNAISYAWGEPIFDHSISVYPAAPRLGETRYRHNNKRIVVDVHDESILLQQSKDPVTMPITKSLYGALRGCRRAGMSNNLVWVDQICINQDDVEERNSQVALMAEIFGSASDVWIWLGYLQLHHEAAFNMAEFLHGLRMSFDQLPVQIMTELRGRWFQHNPAVCFEDALAAFATIATKPWFERLWVVQESLINYNQPKFICGQKHIGQRQLILALQQYVQLTNLVSGHMADTSREERIIKLYDITWSRWLRHLRATEAIPRRLLGLMLDTSHLKASEPRDRVFALTSLADMDSRKSRQRIPVDYSIELPDLWLSVARFIVRYAQSSLDAALVLALPATQLETAQSTMSWAPDFGALTAESRRKRMWYACDGERSSAGGPPCIGAAPEEDQQALNVMKRKGVMIGEVIAICPDSGLPLLRNIPQSNESTINLATDLVHQHFARLDFCRKGTHLSPNDLNILLRQGVRQNNPPYHKEPRIRALIVALERQGIAPNQREDIIDHIGNLCLTEDVSYMDHSRLLACTGDGSLGWVPERSEPGDTICLFEGFPAPFILRKLGDGDFEIIGDAYIHGIMKGEAWPEDENNIQTISLK